ncbi:MAG: enoyl-CoA hydratase/isomerase family protein [Deltaproteobacteria bacterium]|nr:enoyl-CoA hydratase/isomerase family protein [Deltaproteobacteria bacterium]MBW2044745.1 enoyl-CoA hydratase/isomerase family protein [Deltaproteobacteria bacterium]MBW2301708.1 enoyl-CoA hydratase/isomerase family protein [Deltaproteobacteria bacterium]
MVNEKIVVEQHEGVAILFISNPPANSLDRHTLKSLEATMQNLGRERILKTIILTGRGGLFSAGAELKELAAVATSKEAERIVTRAKSLFERIENFKKPVIAAIDGMCLGGGLELALACHMRIADEKARFGFPEINLGLMPGAGGTQRLPRLVGFPQSFEMILTGELIDVKEARRIGLVNAIAPPGKSVDIAKGLAEKMSNKSQVAVRSVLEAIRSSANSDASEGMEKETLLFGRLFETGNAKEGISAFLEKRKPKLADE